MLNITTPVGKFVFGINTEIYGFLTFGKMAFDNKNIIRRYRLKIQEILFIAFGLESRTLLFLLTVYSISDIFSPIE